MPDHDQSQTPFSQRNFLYRAPSFANHEQNQIFFRILEVVKMRGSVLGNGAMVAVEGGYVLQACEKQEKIHPASSMLVSGEK